MFYIQVLHSKFHLRTNFSSSIQNSQGFKTVRLNLQDRLKGCNFYANKCSSIREHVENLEILLRFYKDRQRVIQRSTTEMIALPFVALSSL